MDSWGAGARCNHSHCGAEHRDFFPEDVKKQGLSFWMISGTGRNQMEES